MKTNLRQVSQASLPAKPLPSGWDYARMESPQSKRKNEPGRFNSYSGKKGFGETLDDFRERARVE